MSTLKVDNIENLGGEPFEPSGGSGAAAWARSEASGTLINALNLSGEAVAVGVYEYTFSTPMPNTDYSVVATLTATNQGVATAMIRVDSLTTTGFRVIIAFNSTSLVSAGHSVAVFATNALPPKGGTGTDAWVATIDKAGTIGSSFNIASVNRTAAGRYTVTFTTPMPNATYSVVTAIERTTGFAPAEAAIIDKTTTSFGIFCFNIAAGEGEDYLFNAAVNATNATLPDTFTEEQIQGVIDAQPQGIAKAWVNFTGQGTVSINGSFNVSSITDNGTGDYTVNFTNNMPNANYSFTTGIVYGSTARESVCQIRQGFVLVGSIRVLTGFSYTFPTAEDFPLVSVTIHGD